MTDESYQQFPISDTTSFLALASTATKSVMRRLTFPLCVRLAFAFSLVTGYVLLSWLTVAPRALAATLQAPQSTHISNISTSGSNNRSAPKNPGLQFAKPNAVQPSSSTLYDGLGDISFYTYTSLKLNDRTTLKVNVASGNLVLQSSDYSVHGTGLDQDIESYYNSLPSTNPVQEHGKGWSWSTGSSVRLDLSHTDKGITFYEASNAGIYFVKKSDGSFQDAPGLNATLTAQSDGTYVLTFHRNGQKLLFSSDGTLSTIQDKNNNKITLHYDYSTNPALTQYSLDTQNRIVGFTSNAQHQITSVADGLKRTTSYGYDGSNHLTSITNVLGKKTTLAYTGDALTFFKDPLGNITTIDYLNDGSGRVSQITDATNATIKFAYNSGNTVVTDRNGHNTTYNYNGQLQVTKTTDALGHSTGSTFDATTYNVTQYSDALSDFTNFQFSADGRNNLTTVTDGAGAKTTFGYASSGNNLYNPLSQTDPQGNTASFSYDNNGNMLSATDNSTNKGSSYTYNSNGTAASQTDANGKVMSFSYDDKGNLTKVTFPNPVQPISLQVDLESRVTQVVDGKGLKTSFVYDDADHIITVNYNSQSAVDYGYDDNGNVLSVRDTTGTTSLRYDALNRLVTKILPGGTRIDSRYDNVGNLVSYNDGSGEIDYSYDNANRMIKLTPVGGSASNYGYDDANRKTSIRYPNGTGMLLTYDGAGHEVTNVGGVFNDQGQITTKYTSYSYSYQSGSNQTALLQSVDYLEPVNHSGTFHRTFSYDSQARLTDVPTYDSSKNLSEEFKYSYDPVGNLLTSSQKSSNIARNFSYNDANELLSRTTTQPGGSSTENYSYDANGNLTGSTSGPSFTYNEQGQTVSIGKGSNVNNYTYSGTDQTQRVAVNGDAYVYGGLGLTSIKTSAGTTTFERCSCGLLNAERTPDGKRYFYLFDGLGSVVGMTDSSGAEVNRYDYDPYGASLNKVEQSGVNNPWQYASGYFDSSTGLYKYGIRYYDSTNARWTQRMPVGGSLAETVKANPYVYANDNPVNEVDPSGRNPILCGLLIAAVATALAFAIAFIVSAVVSAGATAVGPGALAAAGAAQASGAAGTGLVLSGAEATLLGGVASFTGAVISAVAALISGACSD